MWFQASAETVTTSMAEATASVFMSLCCKLPLKVQICLTVLPVLFWGDLPAR